MVNPDMLTLARELRNHTQTSLALETKISQGIISKYEAGLREVSPKDLIILSEKLKFPPAFFTREGKRHGTETAEVFHRKKKSALQGDLHRLDAFVNLMRLNSKVLLSQVDVNPAYDMPRYDPRGEDSVEDIAAYVRSAWRLPSGPVANLMTALEGASCLIYLCDFGTADVDEITQWERIDSPPVILVNKDTPSDRMRFSLAHALGHLVMHHGELPYNEMEEEADRFASAFLMPANDIIDELPPVTTKHLYQLKPYWKVSVQAMIMRAYQLGLIDDRRKQSLFQMLSRNKQRKREALDFPMEKPALTTELVSFYQGELGYTNADMAEFLGVTEDDFIVWYLGKKPPFKVLKFQDSQNRKQA